MKNNKIIIAVLISALTGTAVSMLLVREHYYAPVIQQVQKKDALHSLARSVCGGSKDSSIKTGCEKIADSPYAKVAGIPLADLGMVFFLMMTLFTVMALISKENRQLMYKYILFWLLVFGSGVDIALLGISILKINTLCTLCVITYIAVWGAAIILGLHLFKTGNNPSEFSEIFQTYKDISLKEKIQLAITALLIAAFSTGATYSFSSVLTSSIQSELTQIRDMQIQKILHEFSQEKAITIQTKGMHLIGEPDAPVTIIKFSDFMCPACTMAAATIDKVIDENSSKVKVYFANYPLDHECNISMKRPYHYGACLLAKGAICADDAGKFHEYYKTVFAKRFRRADQNSVYAIAQQISILDNSFKKCMTSVSADKALQKQMTEADRLKVNGTPTIFINGKEYKYRLTEILLTKIIDRELRKINKEKSKQQK